MFTELARFSTQCDSLTELAAAAYFDRTEHAQPSWLLNSLQMS